MHEPEGCTYCPEMVDVCAEKCFAAQVRPTIARISEQARVHPDTLRRCFKRQRGTSLGKYLRELKIRRAKNLLKGSDLALNTVAYSSGFETRGGFHQSFRKLGTTPLQFRKSQKAH
jgi:AraC-like DNA-binding protein